MTVRTLPFDGPSTAEDRRYILREPKDSDRHDPRQRAVAIIEGFETHAFALHAANGWVTQDRNRWGEEYVQTFYYTICMRHREEFG